MLVENDDNEKNARVIKRCRNRSSEVTHKINTKNKININNYNDNYNNVNYRNFAEKTINKKIYSKKNKTNIISNKNNKNNEVECSKCNNIYTISPEKRFYYCIDCSNIICGKCSKEHYLQNPEHNCSKTNFDDEKTKVFIL